MLRLLSSLFQDAIRGNWGPGSGNDTGVFLWCVMISRPARTILLKSRLSLALAPKPSQHRPKARTNQTILRFFWLKNYVSSSNTYHARLTPQLCLVLVLSLQRSCWRFLGSLPPRKLLNQLVTYAPSLRPMNDQQRHSPQLQV